ncbi:MAG: transglycosylase domain-containing protein, partial [Gemmatimonadota bacterium]
RREISVRRKLREMKVAFSLEDAYTKTEILEAYINQINFDGVYGVQSAAQHYFDKDASQLTLRKRRCWRPSRGRPPATRPFATRIARCPGATSCST